MTWYYRVLLAPGTVEFLSNIRYTRKQLAVSWSNKLVQLLEQQGDIEYDIHSTPKEMWKIGFSSFIMQSKNVRELKPRLSGSSGWL